MQFLRGLGLPEDQAECYDVYGLDEELLEMVPKPVLAVLFLYPLTAKVLHISLFSVFFFFFHFCIGFICVSFDFKFFVISYQSEEERLRQANEKQVNRHLFMYNPPIYFGVNSFFRLRRIAHVLDHFTSLCYYLIKQSQMNLNFG